MKRTSLKPISATLTVFTTLVIGVGCASHPVRPENTKSGINAGEFAKDATEPKFATTAKSERPEATAEYHFSMAQAYSAEGNPDRAIEEYKLTLMYDPASSLVYARLASEYIKKGMLTAAMETCKEALQRDPEFVDARLILAGLYSAAHETQSALEQYEKVLKSNPKHEEAAVYYSQVLVEDERAKDAVDSLHKFLKKNPESAIVWYYLGRAEQTLEHYKESVEGYRKALEIRPGFLQAGLALGFVYEEQKMNAMALQAYKEIYEDSQDTTAAGRIATILLKEEKFKEAVPYLESIRAADPDDMNVRVKLGLIEMELKQYEKAIVVFKDILTKNPESDRIHYYLGSLYEETKQTDLAIEQLRLIKPDSKLFADAAMHVAYLYKLAGKFAEAKAHIQDSIAKSPKVPSFYVFDASLEEEAKNIPKAVTILEGAAKTFPEDQKIHYYLGSLYDRQGKADLGLEQMEEILKVNPENVDALNYIGYTWTVKGIRLNDAEALLKRALQLKPDNGYVQDSWGWYLYTRGRLNEAVVELEKAVRLKPEESTILEHLADAYLRSNLREKALRKYQDALKFADDTDSKKKIESKLQSLEAEIASTGNPATAASQDRSPAGK